MYSKEKYKEYYKRNRKKILKRQAKYAKEQYKKDGGLYAKKQKLRKYGLSVEAYDLMVKAQKNKCAICGKKPTTIHAKTGKPQNLSIDHCHKTGAVRGLLCYRCNTAIGLLEDNPKLVVKAADYLERHARK